MNDEYRNRIIRGNAPDVLQRLPDKLVDCVITSPPYWSLRDYKIEPVVWPDGWKGQLGLEPTIELYLDHLLSIFDLVGRVMKDEGTLWVNLGDSYAGTHISYCEPHNRWQHGKAHPEKTMGRRDKSITTKSLCLIPQRFAIAMVDRGWILRNTIIWHKPSCMPSSAKDRFTMDYEPIYFFVKQGKYWFDQQFDPGSENSHGGGQKHDKRWGEQAWGKGHHSGLAEGKRAGPQGRNKRCVWTVNTQPYPEAHFATFPEKLVEPMILAGCPEFVCPECGKGRERIYEQKERFESGSGKAGNIPVGKYQGKEQTISGSYDIRMGPVIERKEIGLTDCGCAVGGKPGIVLDPFMGSGTVAIVAAQNRRDYLGIDLSDEYNDMSDRRIFDPKNSQINLL